MAGFLLASAGAALAFMVISVNNPAGNDALAQGTILPAPSVPTAAETGAAPPPSVGARVSSPPVSSSTTGSSDQRSGEPHPGMHGALSVASCQGNGLDPTTTYQNSVVALLDNWPSAAASTSTTTATPSYANSLSAGPYTAGTPITVQSITAAWGASPSPPTPAPRR